MKNKYLLLVGALASVANIVGMDQKLFEISKTCYPVFLSFKNSQEPFVFNIPQDKSIEVKIPSKALAATLLVQNGLENFYASCENSFDLSQLEHSALAIKSPIYQPNHYTQQENDKPKHAIKSTFVINGINREINVNRPAAYSTLPVVYSVGLSDRYHSGKLLNQEKLILKTVKKLLSPQYNSDDQHYSIDLTEFINAYTENDN